MLKCGTSDVGRVDLSQASIDGDAMEWLRLAVEFLKTIAWPATAVLIAWRAGPAVLKVISNRSVDLEGFGLKATIGRTVEQQQIAESSVGKPALEPPAAVPPAATSRPAIQIIEQQIRAELNRYTGPQREPALVTALATARLFGQHESHYNRIFGSQIAGLKRLDEVGSVTVAEAQQFFQPYAQLYPQVYTTYGFDGWLGFMIGAGLVARDGDRLTATPFGHDFLVYLREARLTEAKFG
jgi:hypothetical protein